MEVETSPTADGKPNDEKRRARVLLGVTGSVAAVKAPQLVVQLCQFATVKVLLTNGGQNFWDKAITYDVVAWESFLECLDRGLVRVVYAEDEWKTWNRLGDPVEHIDLRNWADLFLIAPLSAHTLAKLAQGLCDDTLSCVARAWRYSSPLVLAPAMNTAMWEHPVTNEQLDRIRSWGATVVNPETKVLACGELGVGALASVDCIANTVRDHIKNVM